MEGGDPFAVPQPNCPMAWVPQTQRACLLASPLEPIRWGHNSGQRLGGGSGAPLSSAVCTAPPCGLGKIRAGLPRQGISRPGMPSLSWEGQGSGEAGPGPYPPSIPTPGSRLGIPYPPSPTAGIRQRSSCFPWPGSAHRLWTPPLESLSIPACTLAPVTPFSSPKSQPSFQTVNLDISTRLRTTVCPTVLGLKSKLHVLGCKAPQGPGHPVLPCISQQSQPLCYF